MNISRRNAYATIHLPNNRCLCKTRASLPVCTGAPGTHLRLADAAGLAQELLLQEGLHLA